jgi:hypothetical protein
MKIILTEEQFKNLYNVVDRPQLTEVEYIDDDNLLTNEEVEINKDLLEHS